MKHITKKCACGCNKKIQPGNTYINGHNRKNIILSEEIRLKMSESHLGEDGGTYEYFHLKAKKLYKVDTCSICGITVAEKKSNQQMDMHCVDQSDVKGEEGWRNLNGDNWRCICRSCHMKIHAKLRKGDK